MNVKKFLVKKSFSAFGLALGLLSGSMGATAASATGTVDYLSVNNSGGQTWVFARVGDLVCAYSSATNVATSFAAALAAYQAAGKPITLFCDGSISSIQK